MADAKISNLIELNEIPADNDVLAIVDASANETKKINVNNLTSKRFDVTNGHNHDGTNSRKVNHNDLLNAGTNTHSQIDAHISSTSAHGVSEVVGTTESQNLSNKNLITSIDEKTASYTLVLSDAGKMISMNSSSANTITIPPNSSVAFPVGTKIIITQNGTGSTTIQAGSGVTLNAPASVSAQINEQYGSRVILKVATDTWLLV